MRMVRITIEYDMDDQEKPLEAELADWAEGNITLADLPEGAVKIEEVL